MDSHDLLEHIAEQAGYELESYRKISTSYIGFISNYDVINHPLKFPIGINKYNKLYSSKLHKMIDLGNPSSLDEFIDHLKGVLEDHVRYFNNPD